MSETPEFRTTVTDYPVEKTANVADHMRKELVRVTLEVYVSDTPLVPEDLEGNNTRGGGITSKFLDVPRASPAFSPTPGAVFGAIGNAISNTLLGAAAPLKVQALNFANEFRAAEDCLKLLEKIRDNSELVDVYTSARIYEGFALEKIGGPKVDKDSGGGASFTLDFKEVRRANVAIVAAPKPSIVQAFKMKERGKQDPAPVTDPTKRSVLQSLRKGLP
jgi:hypothetical protein